MVIYNNKIFGDNMSQISYELMMQMLRKKRYSDIAKYDKVVDLGVEAMWKDMCAVVVEHDIDPVDLLDEELEDLRNMQYSMKLMNICCLSETWEQDLYNYLKEKGLNQSNSNDYKNTKKAFEEAFPSCAISNYSKIEEMRALVNAIKHGEGNSLTNLRRITSDEILADSNIGIVAEDGRVEKKKQIEFDCNTLTSRTLKVDGRLKTYSDEIIKFWNDVFIAEKGDSHELG